MHSLCVSEEFNYMKIIRWAMQTLYGFWSLKKIKEVLQGREDKGACNKLHYICKLIILLANIKLFILLANYTIFASYSYTAWYPEIIGFFCSRTESWQFPLEFFETFLHQDPLLRMTSCLRPTWNDIINLEVILWREVTSLNHLSTEIAPFFQI